MAITTESVSMAARISLSPHGGRRKAPPVIHSFLVDRANKLEASGGSLFVYLWTSGHTTTESIPMDILSLDEMQEMTLEQMEKVYERLSASQLRFMMMGSRANWPEADIDHWYRRGSQHRFHTRCPTCGGMRPVDDYFPDCIRRDGQE
jgi:phage terminase large subunit GpA-like protein